MPDLLPKNSSALERALADVAYDFNHEPTILTLWNADECPLQFLPYLAWSLSVDEWDHTWSEDRKREACRAARHIHQHKGTPYGVKQALSALGQADATVIERVDYIRHNGLAYRNGTHKRRGQAGWATFRVVLTNPITIDQAALIYRTLESVKRFCVELVAVDFRQAALRRNGKYKHNGEYSRGIV